MTEAHFKNEMTRLVSVFGKNHYPDARLTLIWREVRSADEKQFVEIINRFIGEHRQPPLLPEFRTAMAVHRERSWSQEKAQYANEAKSAYRALSKDESSLICQAIRGVMLGRVSLKEADGAIECVYGSRA